MKPVIGFVFSIDMENRPNKYVLNVPYVAAVIRAGGIPLPIPVDGDPSRALDYIDMIDGLLLPGGEDVTPFIYGEEPVPQVTYMIEDKDRMEMELIRLAMERKKPIFGICRGMQILTATLGGNLYQDLNTQYPNVIAHRQNTSIRSQLTHTVKVEPGSLMAKLLGEDTLRINSYHHQAVKEVPAGFSISVVAPDGVAEAMESSDGTMFAVQWHPEELVDRYPRFMPLFDHLIALAKKNK